MLKLRDIMTRDVITLDSDLSVRDAMALLAGRHVSGAPVVSGANVIGVISGTDLLDFASSLPGIPIEQPEEPVAEPIALEYGVDWLRAAGIAPRVVHTAGDGAVVTAVFAAA